MAPKSYDVVVAGGSIAGLLCAREVASAGHSVLVLERSQEIGTPQHCGGLVSRAALDYLGVVPSNDMAGNAISKARVVAPGGHAIQVDAGEGIIEVDRRQLDKYAAEQARRAGARIMAGTTFRGATDTGVKSSAGDVSCSVVVDARGASQLSGDPLLASAQYEVRADWIHLGQVVVILDQAKYPGFFAWVIPSRSGAGKVGVAGRRINVTAAIESLLACLGEHSVFRRILAPVWVGGPVANPVRGRTVLVGDAAGQAKPTTGGGIYSSGAGGMLAGRAIARYVDTGNPDDLQYHKAWHEKFGREFEAQRMARGILERLDNAAIDSLVQKVRPEALGCMMRGGDFDFHAGSILALLGARGAAQAAGTVTASEMRRAAAHIRGVIGR